MIKNQKPEGIGPYLALRDSIWRLKDKFYTNEIKQIKTIGVIA